MGHLWEFLTGKVIPDAVWTLSACMCSIGYCVLFNTQDYSELGAASDVMDLLASRQDVHVQSEISN